jgi:FAD/FMN-containing dehydrogenase
MIDKRPAIIAYCAKPSDVVESIAFAREIGLSMAVRSGGHNIAGKSLCEDGLVLDLSRMRSVTIDSESRTAHAQGGALLADLDVASQAHGLATTTGVNSDTGLVGLTLGGGLGRLGRKHGLSCDNMAAAEVVTADGQILKASESENADLFWALRGGGGNFGVVTEVVYCLHPLGPMVLAGSLIYRWRDARAALRLYAEFSAAAPDEISADATLMTLPGGDRAVSISAFYAGPLAEAERALQPLRKRAHPARGPHSPDPLR